jgi:uncharacterized RDD family membrane protein YckC
MKPKFELDDEDGACCSARLIDPDAFDASEQQFAASVEGLAAPANPNFVLDGARAGSFQGETMTESAIRPEPCPGQEPDQDPGQNLGQEPSQNPNQNRDRLALAHPAAGCGTEPDAPAARAPSEATASEATASEDPDSWRNEVAARVNTYRARRRPREPRYPSLQLKFEPHEPASNSRSTPPEAQASVHSARPAFSLDSVAPAAGPPLPELVESVPPAPAAPETTARILEFPRSLTFVPPQPLDELAEPVFDRPRILEVPEVAPPPPALGGILIESAEQPASERRPGFEIPLQPAPMSRRLAAAVMDAVTVLSALGVFSYIFFRITGTIPPLQQAAGTIAVLAGMLWAGYQYLLLVYTGTTPGLKLAKLRLDRFDGSPVPRRVRRWRVFASALSGLSLGLGYAWCFLDEDELCWHDRITRTYMAPIK